MMHSLTSAAVMLVFWGAFLRAAGVIVGLAHTLLHRARFRRFRVGWPELVTWAEPFLLVACSLLLAYDRDGFSVWPAPAADAGAAAAALGGALLMLASYGLLGWAFRSWPELFVGHAVLQAHHLVTTGVYGVVRHPVYLAAFFGWLALGVGFQSPVTLAITLAYVLPTYLLYMRSEETMMLEEFGESYRTYRYTVPMLIPHLR